MLCERCKIREAKIKYMEVINGIKTEHNLCSQCAKEMDLGPYSAIFDSEFPLGKLLSGLLGIGEETQEEQNKRSIVCPTCKTSYDTFVKNSCFGCQDCYSVFDPLIYDNIKKLQGSDRHVGKVPRYQRAEGWNPEEAEEQKKENKMGNPQKAIAILNARLKEALQMEDYETAAICRDEIRRLKAAEMMSSKNKTKEDGADA